MSAEHNHRAADVGQAEMDVQHRTAQDWPQDAPRLTKESLNSITIPCETVARCELSKSSAGL